MTEKEKILSFLKEKKSELQEKYQVTRLGLFGSFARHENDENSDIDLLIEFAPNTKRLSEKKQAIRDLVKARFGRKVDLCRQKYIKPYFKSQILQSTIYV